MKVPESGAASPQALAKLGDIAEMLYPIKQEIMENGDIEEGRVLMQRGLQAK